MWLCLASRKKWNFFVQNNYKSPQNLIKPRNIFFHPFLPQLLTKWDVFLIEGFIRLYETIWAEMAICGKLKVFEHFKNFKICKIKKGIVQRNICMDWSNRRSKITKRLLLPFIVPRTSVSLLLELKIYEKSLFLKLFLMGYRVFSTSLTIFAFLYFFFKCQCF